MEILRVWILKSLRTKRGGGARFKFYRTPGGLHLSPYWPFFREGISRVRATLTNEKGTLIRQIRTILVFEFVAPPAAIQISTSNNESRLSFQTDVNRTFQTTERYDSPGDKERLISRDKWQPKEKEFVNKRIERHNGKRHHLRARN